MPDPLVIESLATYDVPENGAGARLHFVDSDGKRQTLFIPIDILKVLTLSMPKIMSQALQARHRDASLRLVHTVKSWQVERASDGKSCILTFTTPDHFCISFNVDDCNLDRLSEAVSDYELEAFPEGLHFH